MTGQYGVDHIAAHRRQLRADQRQRETHSGSHFVDEARTLGMVKIHRLQQTPGPPFYPSTGPRLRAGALVVNKLTGAIRQEIT